MGQAVRQAQQERSQQPALGPAKPDPWDAAAISVAAAQPSIGSVPVKSIAEQASAMLLSVRELLVRQRSQLVSAPRGHAAELGIVAPSGDKGLAQLQTEITAAEAADVPAEAKQALALLGREVERIEARLVTVDAKVMADHKANPLRRQLAAIPGVGPIAALSFALRVDASQFRSRRHFAACPGLDPGRAGDERLRALLGLGATAVVRHAQPGRPGTSAWLPTLLERKPRKLAAVALANKNARSFGP